MTVEPIGRRDRRITIQKQIQGQGSDYGEPTISWIDFDSVWASYVTSGGREFEQARQVIPELDAMFQIVWVKWIKPTMRISYNNRIYHILRIGEVGRNRLLNLYTKAKQ